MNKKTIMIAIGGNAISSSTGDETINESFSNTRSLVKNLKPFFKLNCKICINHGNGPQVGNELMRMELTRKTIPPLPLGVCVSNTQGSIGYMLQQTIQNHLRFEKIDREVVTLVSQVIIDKDDPSIKSPTKFVGPKYIKKDILKLKKIYNWNIKEQEPNQWRRVVPSPFPKYVMHGKSIKTLVNSGVVIIAGGGGGIPVYNNENGLLEGLDAVIDKDYVAAKLGHIIKANELWILTNINCLFKEFLTEKIKKKPIRNISFDELKVLYESNIFQKGSIAPKVKSALHFLKHGGDKVVITSAKCIEEAIKGTQGTHIRN